MASENWCYVTSSRAILLFSVFMTVSTAPVLQHISCVHNRIQAHTQSNRSTAMPSAQLIKSAILSSLRESFQVREENLSESPQTRLSSTELNSLESEIFRKLFNAITKQEKKEAADQTPNAERRHHRCGRRCRRRRRHNRRLQNSGDSLPNTNALPFKPKSDPNILKSNKPAVVITKDSDILRQDWCKTEPLKQQIREPGCKPKTVVNNFCYGQCNSFFIPSSDSSDLANGRKATNSTLLAAPAFVSCAVCKPSLTSWTTVKLRCPGMIPPTRTKRIMRVHKCRCQAQHAT